MDKQLYLDKLQWKATKFIDNRTLNALINHLFFELKKSEEDLLKIQWSKEQFAKYFVENQIEIKWIKWVGKNGFAKARD